MNDQLLLLKAKELPKFLVESLCVDNTLGHMHPKYPNFQWVVFSIIHLSIFHTTANIQAQ